MKGIGNACYRFETRHALSWQSAQKACNDDGAYLATLESEGEVAWMRGYRSWHPVLREKAWIGGQLDDGVWKWQHPEEPTLIRYFNWATGQPDSKGSKVAQIKSGCVCLFGERGKPDESYHFDDDDCLVSHGYVCEKHVVY